jgi:hypothetical protein
VGFNFTFGLGASHFTFVSMDHFHDHNPGRFRVEHREVTKIYSTTVINNQIIRGNNNTLINRGVPVDRVARATHSDIRPIHIQANADAPHSAQLGHDGRTLSVFRPELPKPRAGQPPRLVGEDVKPAPNFNLHSRMERQPAQRNSVVTSMPDHRPVISNPAMNRPAENPGRDNRDNRFAQPTTEKPGSVIMRGANQPDRPNRATPSREDGAQPVNPGLRHGPEFPPQSAQPDRGNNNPRTATPPLRPQDPGALRNNPTAPAFNRPDNNQPRNDGEQLRQQRQMQQQQERMQQQQNQIQQRELQQRQQRDFQPQPVAPTPRQEAPRSFEAPGSAPPVRSEPAAPPRSFESRPAPETRSAPPQYSAPAQSRSDGGGNRDNGNNNGNGNGRNR